MTKIKAAVFNNDDLAGYLSCEDGTYIFEYSEDYLKSCNSQSISLTMPKRVESYTSDRLFPFFFGMLSESILKELQCRELSIKQDEYFNLLIHTAGRNSIGGIWIKEVDEN